MVVVAHASAATLGACLAALPVDRLHGVVVVDNGSPDDSADVARSIDGVRVVVQANLGFGAGCNAGAAALPGAELLLFLNPDAVLRPADLALLVAHLDDHPRCALAGPRLSRDGAPLPSAGRRSSLATELRLVAPVALARRLPQRRFPADRATTGPVPYVEGACFLVRAACLSEAGGFDEALFLFYEELDLARRLHARGWTTDLVAAATAEHLVARSRAVLADRGRTHLLRSSALHLHRRSPLQAHLLVLLGRASLATRRRSGALDAATARAWRDALVDGLRVARGSS